MKYIISFTILITLLCPFQLDAQMLDSLDRAVIDSALKLIKLNPAELGFDKLWAEDDTFRLDIVEYLLANPLEFPDYVDHTTEVIDSFNSNGDFIPLFDYISEQLIVDIKDTKRKAQRFELDAEKYSVPYDYLIRAFEEAEPLRQEFYQELDSLELNDLIMAAPTMWNEDEDSIKAKLAGSWQFEAGVEVDTSKEVDSDRLLDIIAELDTRPLMEAAGIILTKVNNLTELCKTADYQKQIIPDGAKPLTVEGVTGDVWLYTESDEWGRMIVGGTGNNVYEGEFSIIIDLGGDDVYRGRYAGGMGELGYSYSIVIDMEGDDYYNSLGQPVSHGAGFFGIGVLMDCEGNDTYRSDAYSQGAGFFGVGALIDKGGNDDYNGRYFQHGAGHCGAGILIDKGEGDDHYSGTAWSQGFASTYGYGLLYDEGGDEIYRTGGAYYHAPLLPHDYRSFSGGFGMGWRPRAGGGIGVLYDNGDGNDFYNSEVMSLGSSYWYSIGILVDGGGNDHYSLAHYGLGVGIHLSLGALYDISGDDQYRSRMGVVGGTPHDLSVGMFVDGSGDDYYLVSDGWGGSLTNSFGLFIDRLGNDTYATRGTGYSFGKARWARGFAGVAIFIDEEGDDVYPAGVAAADSAIWIEGGWGIGIDLPREVPDAEKDDPPKEDDIVLTVEDSTKSVEDLFEEASQWEVGSARESVRRARKALLERGSEAIHYAVAEKFDTKSGLVYRVLERIVKAMPDTSAPLLIDLMDTSDDETTVKNAIRLLGTIKWKPAVEPMLAVLMDKDKEKVWNTVISALGQIGDDRASNKIIKFITDRAERRRLTVIGALGQIGDTTTIPLLVRVLDDPMFTVRSAAFGTIIGFGVSAVYDLEIYITDSMVDYPELGLRALGKIIVKLEDQSDVQSKKIKYEAMQLFEEYLSHPYEQMRAASVDALYRNGGEAARLMIEGRMEYEYSPVVLAAYAKVVDEFGTE
ncbi:MAG: HEAT repeat domain-containing protein [Calditrichaeota bacterium]|nr:HEAT repeat domain-containing protein [Calditrichota bacterium]